MNTKMQVELRNVKMRGLHGLIPGEKIIAGEFEINVKASFIPPSVTINEIEETIDYTQLLKIVRQRLQQPTHLVETLASEIASEIIAKFSIVTEVEISIYKLHPPIENFEGSVGVTYKRNR